MSAPTIKRNWLIREEAIVRIHKGSSVLAVRALLSTLPEDAQIESLWGEDGGEQGAIEISITSVKYKGDSHDSATH